MPDARRWSLEDPYLHEVAVTVGAAGDSNPGGLGPVRGGREETQPYL